MIKHASRPRIKSKETKGEEKQKGSERRKMKRRSRTKLNGARRRLRLEEKVVEEKEVETEMLEENLEKVKERG